MEVSVQILTWAVLSTEKRAHITPKIEDAWWAIWSSCVEGDSLLVLPGIKPRLTDRPRVA
jgi:hypothetical protein